MTFTWFILNHFKAFGVGMRKESYVAFLDQILAAFHFN